MRGGDFIKAVSQETHRPKKFSLGSFPRTEGGGSCKGGGYSTPGLVIKVENIFFLRRVGIFMLEWLGDFGLICANFYQLAQSSRAVLNVPFVVPY